MACGIGLQKLCMHNWAMDNSFVWYIISTIAALHTLVLRRNRRGSKHQCESTKEYLAVGVVL